jgi:sugar phosphate isomerase/epimerase
MKIAIQENLVPGKNFSDQLYNIEKFGFEGVEIWGFELEKRIDEVKSSLETSKVKISTICVGYEGSLLGSERKERESAIEGLKNLLKMCSDLGAVGVITVPAFGGPKISDLYPWNTDIKEVEKRILVEECKILEKTADEYNSFVLLEPLNRYETHFLNTLQDAVDICKETQGEHIKIMADFFHMNIEETKISESIKNAFDYILHVHLADSNRLLPGYGHIDFETAFKTLKENEYSAFLTLECGVPGDPYVELPKCANYLKNFI